MKHRDFNGGKKGLWEDAYYYYYYYYYYYFEGAFKGYYSEEKAFYKGVHQA